MSVVKDHLPLLDWDNHCTLLPCCGKAKQGKARAQILRNVENVERFTHKPVQHVELHWQGKSPKWGIIRHDSRTNPCLMLHSSPCPLADASLLPPRPPAPGRLCAPASKHQRYQG